MVLPHLPFERGSVEITLAYNQVGNASIIEIAAKSVTGPFRFELERFIESQIATNNIVRAAVTWAALRDHLATQFLNVDESAALKDDLDRVIQSAFDPTQTYVRRIREVADVAYPIMLRNIDQERLLVKTFARGLSSDAIAAKLIEQDPQSLEASITIVTHACSRLDAYTRLRRGEVAMEVGSTDSSRPPENRQRSPSNATRGNSSLCRLQRDTPVTSTTRVSRPIATERRRTVSRPSSTADTTNAPSTFASRPTQVSDPVNCCATNAVIRATTPLPVPSESDTGRETQERLGFKRPTV